MKMLITNKQSGTNVHEIADGIYRINTPVVIEGGPGGFSFNQFLIADDTPLLFHTGPRKMFPLVREAVASVLPVERLRHVGLSPGGPRRRCRGGGGAVASVSPVHRLRYVGLSHVEADECGSLNEWLAAAPQS